MSRRSRAVRKGVIQATRHERHRQSRQDLPPNANIIIVLVVAVFVVGVMLLAALNKDDTSSSATTIPGEGTDEMELNESNCVALRRAWTDQVVEDFEQAQATQATYISIGCEGLCGGLVEDTDTPVTETRCAYP